MDGIKANTVDARRQGVWLQTLRVRRLNMSQSTLAAKLGVTHGAVSHVETGRMPISDKLWAGLCKELNADPLAFPRFDPNDSKDIKMRELQTAIKQVVKPVPQKWVNLKPAKRLEERRRRGVYIDPWRTALVVGLLAVAATVSAVVT